MPGGFLYSDLIADAVLASGAASVSTMPLSNLQDPQPRVRTRFVGGTVSILADLLASRSLDCVYLGSTTLTSGATIRVRLSASDVTGAAGEAWDTGVVSASTGDEANGQMVVLRTAGPASGRYLMVDLVDAALSVIDIGVLAAGALWRVTRAQSYGYREGRLILDREDRNAYTGAVFPAPALSNPRFAAFQIAWMGRTETEAQHREMIRRNGATRPALWIPDLSLSQAEINNRSIWGAVAQPGEEAAPARPAFAGWTRSWRVVERL